MLVSKKNSPSMCHTPLESYDSQDSSCVCEEMGCREDMREINEIRE